VDKSNTTPCLLAAKGGIFRAFFSSVGCSCWRLVFTILSYCDQKLQRIQMDASRGVPSAFSVEHKAQLDAELMEFSITLHMGTVPYVC
jgi:hypothetical protein